MHRLRHLTLVILSAVAARGASAQGTDLSSRAKGRPGAPITVYEMSDFQCPYCREFALETMPILEREYIATGKIRFIYINLPLTNIHAHALTAAHVAMCAARQGKFWPVHDRFFRRQLVWASQAEPQAYLIALADSAGANPAELRDCVTSNASDATVNADIAAAERSGARSTPTFYIEGGLIEGAAPAPVFRQVLDSIYQAKTAPPAVPPPAHPR